MYAVGAVAYQLLSAKPLFPYRGVELLHHVIHTEPEPLSKLAPEIPAPLAAVVMRCLNKDPAARPRSARELREQLLALPGIPPWQQEDARQWWDSHNSS